MYETAIETVLRREDVRFAGPVVLSWVLTDGRFLRSRGLPVYGFTPFLFLTPETMRAANRNEKIPAPAFVQGMDLYRDLVFSLVAPPP